MPEKTKNKSGALRKAAKKATPKAKACKASSPALTEAANTAPKRGRPTVYTEALAGEICQRLADGEALKSICRLDGMPSFSTVLAWALDSAHPFYDRYARARDIGYRHLAEEILEISDNAKGDFVQGEDGRKVVDHEAIARARLRVDSRKWLLSKMLPKLYGEKVVSELTGPDGGPVQVDVNRQVNEFLAKLDAIRRRQKELAALEATEAEEDKR